MPRNPVDPTRVRRMRRGDTGPALELDLTENGAPAGDLTGATIALWAVREGGAVVLGGVPATSGPAGRVTVPTPLPAALTAYAGRVHLEVKVTADGVTATYPDGDPLVIDVLEDLAP